MEKYQVEVADYGRELDKWSEFPKGTLCEKWHDASGRLHRLGGPALIVREPETYRQLAEAWYEYGRLHRDAGPALYCEQVDNSSECTAYLRNGELHREGGPAILKLAKGSHTSWGWYINGQAHRIGGPSSSLIDLRSDIVVSEAWQQHGVYHRINAAAYMERDDETGIVTSEMFYQNGLVHRVDGPACIFREATGKLEREEFYLNDVEYPNGLPHGPGTHPAAPAP